jgi:peptidoglycan/LPS O-acetylase OafA/YrhL
MPRADLDRRVPAFDGVRAGAIAGVFLFHAFSSHKTYGAFAPVRLGNLGVEAFFVLSGFLITLRILALAEREDLSAGGRWRAFLRRRSLRIFPLYFATLILLALFGRELGFVVSPLAWPFYITYTANVLIFLNKGWVGAGSHFWSLCVEEQFYLVFPILVFTRVRRALPILVMAAIAGTFVARLALAGATGRGAWAWVLAPMHFDSLGAGIGAALLVTSGTDPLGRLARAIDGVGCLAAVAFAGVAVALPASPVANALLPTALALAIGPLLVALWNGRVRPVAWVLSVRPLVMLGRVSYGVYVFHLFFIVALWRYRGPWLPPVALLRGGVAFLLATACAAISWRFFERPILELSGSESQRGRSQIPAGHPPSKTA